jgi:LmbE family N-acetylglucosaminyl deacetylase
VSHDQSPGNDDTHDLDVPARALVIVAHPDDAEFQAGATLAKWSRLGSVVHHLVLTDGSKGTWDAHVDQAALVQRRQQEQRAAAAALGATGEVVFLGEVDGELGTDTSLRGRVAAVIRRLRPAVVIGHDPWKRYRLHPDHHAAGRLCVDGIVAARDPFFHPELLRDGLEPHRPDALLLFEADVENHSEVVDEVDLTARNAALEAHVSQMETTHFYRVDADLDPLEGFRRRERDRLEEAGRRAGVPLAERYHLIVDQL